MVEAMIRFDPYLRNYSYEGVPDIRVIAFKGVPVMAMVRCATHESDGKGQPAPGRRGCGHRHRHRQERAGGTTRPPRHPAPGHRCRLRRSPAATLGPYSRSRRRCVEMTGLGYLGVDIVLDDSRPHAAGTQRQARPRHPGVANMAGLRHRLAIARKIAAQTDDHDRKIALARESFGVRV